MKRTALALVPLALLTACSGGAADPQVIAADPWVRTTDGSQMPTMTALFVNLTNPSEKDVRLTKATCEGDVAARYELHEMVKGDDGKKLMREAENGIVVEAGKHQHLAPGGPHIMLMDLKRELPAGAEELKCTLEFDSGQTIDITAPVKQFTEEQDTYHEH